MTQALQERALAMAARTGNTAVFTRPGTGTTYDPVTDTWTSGAAESASAPAVEKRGDPDRFRALGLVLSNPVTLVVTRPDDMAFPPESGQTLAWSGVTYTVADVLPTSLDGEPIMWEVTGTL